MKTLKLFDSTFLERKNINQMVLVLQELKVDFDLGTKSEGITERVNIRRRLSNYNIKYKHTLG